MDAQPGKAEPHLQKPSEMFASHASMMEKIIINQHRSFFG
jgi:hypothetical protein